MGWFHEVVGVLHGKLYKFVHSVVVHRTDEALRSLRSWLREDPSVQPYRWLRPDVVPRLPFYAAIFALLLVGLDEEFRKA